jgi:hypothetical protein
MQPGHGDEVWRKETGIWSMGMDMDIDMYM